MEAKELIDKSTVVEEIIKIYDRNRSNGYIDTCNEIDDILSFIDTLEVKDVDLEKEFDNYTKNILACDIQFEPFTHLYNCAKYFFELGMQQSKNDNNNGRK